MSFICHIHNYTEYNEEWNVFSAFNPSKCAHLEQWAAECAAPGEQSWTSCRSRDSNPQPWVTSGFKSNALSIRPTTAQSLVHPPMQRSASCHPLALRTRCWAPSCPRNQQTRLETPDGAMCWRNERSVEMHSMGKLSPWSSDHHNH